MHRFYLRIFCLCLWIRRKRFKENEEFLNPINAYAYTKYIFDNFVKYTLEKSNVKSKIIGLRFFNVYGPGEYFKGEMCSPVYKFYNQIKKNGYCKIFDRYGGYEKGMHLRDFINVLDCCKIIDFVSASSTKLNIFNVGTAKPVSFLKIARTVLDYLNLDQNQIEFIPFPESLKGNYQSYTCADINNLKSINYNNSFLSIEEGIKAYIDVLEKKIMNISKKNSIALIRVGQIGDTITAVELCREFNFDLYLLANKKQLIIKSKKDNKFIKNINQISKQMSFPININFNLRSTFSL